MFPFNIIKRSYEHKVDATGLAVFRIVYGVTLFLQILYLSYFQKLIFVYHTSSHRIVLILWLFVSFLLIIGWKTRMAAIINYLYSILVLNSLYGDNRYVYDYDKIMIAANFLLMFLPVSRVLSVDHWIKGRRPDSREDTDTSISILFYYIPMFLCLGIPYIDSVYHKLLSMNWLTGVGIWIPMSMPQMTWPPFWDFSLVLNNRLISDIMNYLTMLFELTFIFTFWFRRMRLILFVIGIGFHIGILLIFPIPVFALGCASFYILLLPQEWWRKLVPGHKITNSTGSGEAKNKNTKVSLPKDSRKIYLIASFFILSTCMQLGYFFDYVFDYNYGGKPVLINYKHDFTKKQWKMIDGLITINKYLLPVYKSFFGIGPHDVMLDNQCEDYDLIWAVVYTDREGREQWLPIINKDGHPGFYAMDRGWSKWTHYVRRCHMLSSNRGVIAYKNRRKNYSVKSLKLESSSRDVKPVLVRFIEFWCSKNDVQCETGQFTLKERGVIASRSWQHNILKKQKNFSWADIGDIHVTADNIVVDIYKEHFGEHLEFQRD
ncbi:MAG: HTTM domain-containing protein [Candidatus Omnitrophota bacterium]